MNNNQSNDKPNIKKKLGWSLAFVVIAAASIWAITSQSKSFSFGGFMDYIKSADPLYFSLAVICMLGFIAFEGIAVISILDGFGQKRSLKSGFVYSAADVYFSAITPSATGGQPVSAYFMIKDGISGAMATVALLLNLVMYALAIIAIGVVSFVFNFKTFHHFGALSKFLILLGCLLQIGLVVFFWMVLKKETILHRFCKWGIRVLNKLHIIKHPEKQEQKIDKIIADYKECAAEIKGKTAMLVKAFIFNFLQRVSTVSVSMFVYLSAGGSLSRAFDIWAAQSYVILGSNCIPIPGAMGVSDYLMIDGFSGITNDPVNLELLSRSVSFYSCVILCGITILIKYFAIKRNQGRLGKVC